MGNLSKDGVTMSVLEKIKSAVDVKKLNIEELKSLSEELREKIIQITSQTGGHLASNLGMIETTVALYHTFDFSKDKLIFDVGHQCYAHKLLTGRFDKFSTLGLDYKPAFKSSEEYISFLIKRDDTTFDIPDYTALTYMPITENTSITKVYTPPTGNDPPLYPQDINTRWRDKYLPI